MTLDQLKTQRDALQAARCNGVLTIKAGDKWVTYRSDAELQSALHDLEREIALAEGRPRARRMRTICGKGLPPRWDWVDPLKDIRAEIVAIEAGLKSRTQAIAERGFDAVAVDAEIASDPRREDSLGLLFGREPPTPVASLGQS